MTAFAEAVENVIERLVPPPPKPKYTPGLARMKRKRRHMRHARRRRRGV